MAERKEVASDRAQVKKAVQASQAFLKTQSSGESSFPEDNQPISLLFTSWKVPKAAQTIRIPLPHGQRPDTEEVCLFTKDEPKMTPEQTQRFYKKSSEERGVKNVSEVIPFKSSKAEYKPYEAKRRSSGNFDMFSCDERIRRSSPSHSGKHFYERKKMPSCINSQSKHSARDVQRITQGTSSTVTNKGCCWFASKLRHTQEHASISSQETPEQIRTTKAAVSYK